MSMGDFFPKNTVVACEHACSVFFVVKILLLRVSVPAAALFLLKDNAFACEHAPCFLMKKLSFCPRVALYAGDNFKERIK